MIFNKKDVLEEKLKTVKFSKFYPKFAEQKLEENVENVTNFLKKEFLNIVMELLKGENFSKNITILDYVTVGIKTESVIPVFQQTIKKFF